MSEIKTRLVNLLTDKRIKMIDRIINIVDIEPKNLKSRKMFKHHPFSLVGLSHIESKDDKLILVYKNRKPKIIFRNEEEDVSLSFSTDVNKHFEHINSQLTCCKNRIKLNFPGNNSLINIKTCKEYKFYDKNNREFYDEFYQILIKPIFSVKYNKKENKWLIANCYLLARGKTDQKWNLMFDYDEKNEKDDKIVSFNKNFTCNIKNIWEVIRYNSSIFNEWYESIGDKYYKISVDNIQDGLIRSEITKEEYHKMPFECSNQNVK